MSIGIGFVALVTRRRRPSGYGGRSLLGTRICARAPLLKRSSSTTSTFCRRADERGNVGEGDRPDVRRGGKDPVQRARDSAKASNLGKPAETCRKLVRSGE